MSSPMATGQANTVKQFFSRRTRVAIDIDAPAEKIWGLLVDSDSYPSWNSTVLELSGRIALGERIRLRSSLAPTRTFKLKVKVFEGSSRLCWGDAMGTRVFDLKANARGGTCFTMSETIGGPLFPLFERMIPSFDESFGQFARDLKAAAERGSPA
ncbi:MAG: polyketide cyclase/dehydrase [Gammaproteobacteria bacterium RIFCSPHIGHO2_12_FULL_63_22]|nr:MAG: polyketide cyclase/dehydrase [Gammaproteobacteria bacterium RIFCSPHIGHO2_12_FULL_63_22]